MPMTESDQRYYHIRAGCGVLSIDFVFSGKYTDRYLQGVLQDLSTFTFIKATLLDK